MVNKMQLHSTVLYTVQQYDDDINLGLFLLRISDGKFYLRGYEENVSDECRKHPGNLP